MSAAIPSSEPTNAVAGDTIAWTKAFSDYPASAGWVLSYAFRLQQGNGALNINASASGDNFSAVITAVQSAALAAGIWQWSAYVTLGSERHQVGHGLLTLTPNLATVSGSVDLRSDVKIALDNALAAWKTFSSSKMVVLNGRTYTSRDAGDLIKYVNQCRSDYARELAAQFEPTGINTRRIGVRLSRV